MTSTLIDTNILVEILGNDSAARRWSVIQLARAEDLGRVVINQIIYGELAAGYARDVIGELLDTANIEFNSVSFDAAWQAGAVHGLYRRAGGARERTLPDFLIGAQALLEGHNVLTRDPKRYRSYFPELNIISPDTHP